MSTARDVLDFLDDERLFEMANLRQNDTGLPMIIWVSEQGRTQHGPRIKVSKTHSHKSDPYQTVSVSISDNPALVAGQGIEPVDLRRVKQYIQLNKAVLLAYWEGRISTVELVNRLVKLESSD